MSKPQTNQADESKNHQSIGATAKDEDVSSNSLICSVCLQSCVHPVALPCEHIFCFLCVKGVMARSRSCALCRHPLPLNYCEKPQLLDMDQLVNSSQRAVSSDGYQWFYSGANGWWQYEDRIAEDIEDAYQKKESSTVISVSGFQYVVDFTHMIQYQQSDQNRRRRIKRDVVTIPKKGVAGIPLAEEQSPTSVDRDEDTPTETPSSTHSRREESCTDEDEDENSNESEVDREPSTVNGSNNSNNSGDVENLTHSFKGISLENSEKK